ncbi:unnamed protein product [Spodoptera exigua]|nr:unnamed protein product [Spodoptera exigua]
MGRLDRSGTTTPQKTGRAVMTEKTCDHARILVPDPKTRTWSGPPVGSEDVNEVWRRKCGCIRTSDKLKTIISTFPSSSPPTPMLKHSRGSKSWQVIGDVVQLVQLSVTATALALYYLIYCYMQLVYYTLRSALYFHNADGFLIVCCCLITSRVHSASQHLDSAEYSESTEVSIVSVSSSASAELHEGSGDDPPDPVLSSNLKNETREALKSDGSEQDPVVFLSEKNSYIPVSIKPRSPAVDTAWREPPAWEREYRRHRTNGSRVQYIEAECQDDFMKIRVGFNGSFSGLVYSAGYSYDPDCMYINGTGRDYYEFYIQLNRCGTLGRNGQHDDSRKHPTKNLMWNTITVQYNSLIEEELDEHFKVTCEYGYDFWKTVTFPFLDVE